MYTIGHLENKPPDISRIEDLENEWNRNAIRLRSSMKTAQFKPWVFLAAVCLLTACQQADEEFLIGRWQSSGGPNMIFEKDGTVFSINRGPRRRGRYYLDKESTPPTMIMDMRKSTINAVLWFEYESFSPRHIQLTPLYVQRTGEKKKESESKRKMIFKKLDPEEPHKGKSQFNVSTQPREPR